MQIDKWISPRTLDELQAALKNKEQTDYFISGGTDLLVALRGGRKITGLIDLTQLEALRRVEVDGESLFVGGGLTYDEIARNEQIVQYCPALAKAAGMVGSQQIRNRGTVAGGVANASPAGDIAPALVCLQAWVRLIDDSGVVSKLTVADFLVGAGRTRLQNNQCILGFEIPVNLFSRMAYIKLGSRSQVTIAQMTATMAVAVCGDKIAKCNLVVGSIGVKPVRLAQAESLFIGKSLTRLTEDDFLAAAAVFSRYIKDEVRQEFDRDYKAVAIKGVFLDLRAELMKKITI